MNTIWAQQRPAHCLELVGRKNCGYSELMLLGDRSEASRRVVGWIRFWRPRQRLLQRLDQFVVQSLVRSFGVIMFKILIARISHRCFAEQNQTFESELGTFRAPENRRRVTLGKSITLKYVRFRATTESTGRRLFTSPEVLVGREPTPHEGRDSKCFNRCGNSVMSLHLTNLVLE